MGISTQRAVIQGAKPSKGSMEGVEYDFTELYVQENIDPEVGFGTATVPYKFGKSDNYEMFRGQTKAILADLDVMTITNGRGGSKQIITGVRFVKTEPPKA